MAMGITKRPPIFVPAKYRTEIEKLSKAALMDVVWDLCAMRAESADDDDLVFTEFRQARDIILLHRSQA